MFKREDDKRTAAIAVNFLVSILTLAVWRYSGDVYAALASAFCAGITVAMLIQRLRELL